MLQPLLYLYKAIVVASTLFAVIHVLGTLNFIFIIEKSLLAAVEDMSMYLYTETAGSDAPDGFVAVSTVTCMLVLADAVFSSMSVTPVAVVANVRSFETPAVVENSFVSLVALLVALLPPEPPLELVAELVFDDAAVTATLAVVESEPPELPETDSVSVHVAAEEPAVTVQLCEFVCLPVIVPIVFVPEEIVHPLLLDSVAVTLLDEPAVSVPELYMLADVVVDALVEMLLDAVVREVMLSAAGEVIVIEPQSAVQVEPILTQTSCAPSLVGVTV